MKVHIMFGFVLLILCGCSTYQITSDPPGASVLLANSKGKAFRNWRDKKTPCNTYNPLWSFSKIGVVWPDGTGSEWEELDGNKHFVKQKEKPKEKGFQYKIPSRTFDTSMGEIVLTNLVVTCRGSRLSVEGSVLNHTKGSIRWLSVFIKGKDSDGASISHKFKIKEKIPKGSFSFTDKSYSTFKHPLQGLGISTVNPLFSFTNITFLDGSTSDDPFRYSDRYIDIQFSPITELSKRILFSLKNISGETVEVDWDKIVFVDLSGNAGRVIHGGVKLNEKSNAQAPSFIPANSRISDLLVPVDRIRYEKVPPEFDYSTRKALEGVYGWKYDSLLNLKPMNEEGKCGEFSLHMPLKISGTEREYKFVFVVYSCIEQ